MVCEASFKVRLLFTVESAIITSSPVAGTPGDQLAALVQLTLAVPFQVETAALTVALASTASAAAILSITGGRVFIVLRVLFDLWVCIYGLKQIVPAAAPDQGLAANCARYAGVSHAPRSSW